MPFLDYDVEICCVMTAHKRLEFTNGCYRLAIRARGHFPTEQAAMKCLYLVTRSLDPTGRGTARWAIGRSPYSYVRDHLQRPVHSDRQLTNARIRSTVYRTLPRRIEA